jgi:RNA polymerase sigma-70 factor (ECF subfamily)
VRSVDALTRLALAARDGDRSALDRLLESSYDQVWRLCARVVDVADADDLAQDTFLRAVRSLPSFRGDASARTWLLAIARNTCMDELRTRSRRRARDASLAVVRRDQEGAPADATQEVGVTDMLDRLAPDRREAFVLTQLLGLSYREAAEVCACPTGTIRSRVARARADLLAVMAQETAESDRRYRSETSMYPMTRDMTS